MRSSKPNRQDVANLFRHAESLGLSRDARKRLAWFAYALAHDGNVSLACRYFGISRSTFLRWAKRFDPRRPETLEERSRRPHRVRQPEVRSDAVKLIREYRTKFPTMGKERIAAKLHSEHFVTLSASTVGRVIARECLFFGDRQSHEQKRTGIDFSTGPVSASASATASSVSESESGEAGAAFSDQLPLFGS